MLKLTGAVMIVAAAVIWGIMQADRLKKRQQELCRLTSALSLLENEISYGKRDIKNILITVGEIQGAEIFKAAGEYVEECGIKNGFLKAVENKGEFLSGADKEVLCVLAENLGMTDSVSQIKELRHAKMLLENAAKAAGSEYEKSGKLYRSAGALAGLAAVILLL